MMLILVTLAVFVLLLLVERLWRRERYHPEFTRKFLHISVGVFAATWPFYLSWNEIRLMSIAFLLVVFASKYLGLFQSIRQIERQSWGEPLFALIIGLLTFVTAEPWIYAAALLHLGLADGLAALIGVAYGKTNSYKVFGYNKSVVGSAVFFVTSTAILVLFSLVAVPLSPLVIVGLASAATVVENIGIQGIDNVLVPLLIVAVLNSVA